MADPRDPRVNELDDPIPPSVGRPNLSREREDELARSNRAIEQRLATDRAQGGQPGVPDPVTGLIPERPYEPVISRQTPEQLQAVSSQVEEGLLARVHGRIGEFTGLGARIMSEVETLRATVSSLEARVKQITPEVPQDRLAELTTRYEALQADFLALRARFDAPRVGDLGVAGQLGNPSLVTTRSIAPLPPATPVGLTQAEIDAARLEEDRAAQARQRDQQGVFQTPPEQLERERVERERQAGQ